MSKITFSENYQLHYELIEGEADRPHLVFLHEGLGCHAMWKKFPKLLCKRTGCPGLVYDRLGYGKSSPLRHPRTIHYLHDYALQELPQVVEALIPHQPFILIGHSDGGSISLIFGAEKPPCLKGIITEAAHVFVERETLEGIRKADEAFDKGKFSELSKYHGGKTQAIFKAWSATWLSEWFKYWNIEYLLPSIEVPMLVIQGCDDQYGTQAQVDSIVSKSAGKAVPSLVENCGHSPHQELPELLLEIMSKFITQAAAVTGSHPGGVVSVMGTPTRPDGAVMPAKLEPAMSVARPRPAASLVLIRRARREPEFLLGRRPATMGFMPNAYVFPGGLLEPEDRRIQPASPLDVAIVPHLAVGKDSRLAQALAAAAVRETFEETGLMLGRPGDVGAVRASSSWLAFKKAGLAPDLGPLRYIGRAITPTSSPLRFHARFFLADVTGMIFMPQESTELRDLRWVTLAQAGVLAMAEVTRAVLLEAARLLQDATGEGSAVFSYHRLQGRRVRYHLGLSQR